MSFACAFSFEAPDDYDGACDDIVDTAGMSDEDSVAFSFWCCDAGCCLLLRIERSSGRIALRGSCVFICSCLWIGLLVYASPVGRVRVPLMDVIAITLRLAQLVGYAC